MIGPDQDYAARFLSYQFGAAQNKGSQEKIAKFRIRLNDLPEIILIDFQQLAFHQRPAANQTLTTRKNVDFTGKLAVLVQSDVNCAFFKRSIDLYLTAQDDVEIPFGISRLEDDFLFCDMTTMSERH